MSLEISVFDYFQHSVYCTSCKPALKLQLCSLETLFIIFFLFIQDGSVEDEVKTNEKKVIWTYIFKVEGLSPTFKKCFSILY